MPTDQFKAQDPIGPLVDELCADGKKGEAGKWKTLLERNLFKTCGSVYCLDCEDWVALGFPLPLYGLMRNRISIETHERIKLSDIKSQKPPKSDTFYDLTKYIKIENHNAPSVEASKSIRRRKKGKDKKSGANFELSVNSNVYVIGRENNASFLLNLISPIEEGKETGPRKATTNACEQTVNIQFLDSSVEGESASVLLLCFSTHKLTSLSSIINKFETTIAKQNIAIRIILVGVDDEEEGKNTKGVKLSQALEAKEQMNALAYFKISEEDDAQNLVDELGRIIFRDWIVDPRSKVKDAIQKMIKDKKPELTLRKKQLQHLPNEFLCCTHFLTRIRLDGNSITEFPHELLYCTQLKELSLNNNEIASLPAAIDRLTNLVRFEIESNKLSTLPIYIIFAMSSLVELKVGGNPLKDLPFTLKARNSTLKQIATYCEVNEEIHSGVPLPPPALLWEPVRDSFLVYGAPLEELMENEEVLFPGIPLPRILRYAAEFIYLRAIPHEGIFRLAGTNLRCNILRKEIDESTDIYFLDSENPHNVSSLLKTWIRELPEAVLLFKNYNTVLTMSSLPEKEQVEKLRELVFALPPYNFAVARELFRLMYLISLSAGVNLMSASNITKVIGPNMLFIPEDPADALDPYAILTKTNQINDVLTLGVKHYPAMFEKDTDLFSLQYQENGIEPLALRHRKAYGHVKTIIGLQLTSDHSKVWTYDTKGVVCIWDANDLILLKQKRVHESRGFCMVRRGDQMFLGSGSSVMIFDENSIESDIYTIDNDSEQMDPYFPVFFMHATESKVWIVSPRTLAYIDDDLSAIKEVPIEGGAGAVTSVGEMLWVACFDRKIRILNEEHQVVSQIDLASGTRLNSLAFIENVVWGSCDGGIIFVWDPKTLQVRTVLEGDHRANVFGTCEVAGTVWSYARDALICVHKPSDFTFLGAVPTFHTDSISGAKSFYNFSNQLWTVFTSSHDGSLVMWLVKGDPPVQGMEPVDDATSKLRRPSIVQPEAIDTTAVSGLEREKSPREKAAEALAVLNRKLMRMKTEELELFDIASQKSEKLLEGIEDIEDIEEAAKQEEEEG